MNPPFMTGSCGAWQALPVMPAPPLFLHAPALLLAIGLALPLPGAAKDQDRAQAAVRRGDAVPLAQVTEHALRTFGGRVIEVEIDGKGRRIEYELELLLDDGRVIELKYEGRTGSLTEIKGQRLESLFGPPRPERR